MLRPTARSSCAILNVTRYHPAEGLWYAVPGACGGFQRGNGGTLGWEASGKGDPDEKCRGFRRSMLDARRLMRDAGCSILNVQLTIYTPPSRSLWNTFFSEIASEKPNFPPRWTQMKLPLYRESAWTVIATATATITAAVTVTVTGTTPRLEARVSVFEARSDPPDSRIRVRHSDAPFLKPPSHKSLRGG